MKKSGSKELIVGLITIIGVLILTLSIIWGKNYTSSVEYKDVVFQFESVNRLSVGDRIEVKGVSVGEVTYIDLKDDGVLVGGEVDKNINIYSDAVATVSNRELMGGRILLLNTGKSKEHAKGIIKGKNAHGLAQTFSEMGALFKDVKSFLKKAEVTLEKVDKIIPEKNLDERLDKMTSVLENTAYSIKDDIKELKTQLSVTIEKVDTILDTASVAISDGKESLQNLAEFSKDLKTISKNLDDLLVNANEKIALLSDSSNTVGKLMTDDKIYHDLRQTVNNLDSLITQIKTKGLKTDIHLF